jgi:hypothetical protein
MYVFFRIDLIRALAFILNPSDGVIVIEKQEKNIRLLSVILDLSALLTAGLCLQ